MLNKTFYIVLLIVVSLVTSTFGQSQLNAISLLKSEQYYIFPINPNQPNSLAGNMGELRSSHFHAGLDIRTGGQIGLPVYAAADGYVQRISIATSGYGKALYIKHPNGETTVYAHLDHFNDTITKAIREEQYKNESLNIKLFPQKSSINVNKGDIIAYSGNSGSSGGPHLHFEIRAKDQTVLNPLKYNFEEIKDTTSPIIEKLAITPQNINSRINGEFERKAYTVKKIAKGLYAINDTIHLSGKVGFELLAYDKLDANRFKCGIAQLDFYIDGHHIFGQNIDKLSFSTQRNILKHYNYAAKQNDQGKFHKMYVDDGNELEFYTTDDSKGIVTFDEQCIYEGYIVAKDIYGNQSKLVFPVKCSKTDTKGKPEHLSSSTPTIRTAITNNVMKLTSPKSSMEMTVVTATDTLSLPPSYANHDRNTYLLDLANGLPQRIIACEDTVDTHYQATVLPKIDFEYFGSDYKVHFYKNTLFDTLYFSTNKTIDTSKNQIIYNIGNPKLTPLKSKITVTLENAIQDTVNNNTSVYSISNGSYSFIGGTVHNKNITFNTREFGEFLILPDSTPPTVRPIIVRNDKLRFTIKDDLSGIKSYKVTLNGKWVLMDYDYKTNKIWSLEPLPLNTTNNEVLITLEDNASNITTQTYTIQP